MFVPYQGPTGQQTNPDIDCSSGNFTFQGNARLTDVAVRGVLLSNSNSGFKRGYFVGTNNDLDLTCISENDIRIPFKKL